MAGAQRGRTCRLRTRCEVFQVKGVKTHHSGTPGVFPWLTKFGSSTKRRERLAVKQEVSCKRRKSISNEREYGKNPFTEKELRELIGDSPIEPFLNTRTPLYREKNMKQKTAD
jgi:hypothetical protein